MSSHLDITTNAQGDFVVSSTSFADGLDIQHKNLIDTIKTHQMAIERDFGIIAFETRKIDGRGRPESFALLTEDQALFVGTLSRNSKRVIEFKATLVREFADARRRKAETTTLPATADELILMLAQRNVDTARRVSVLEQKIERIEQIQHDAEVELLALPAPTESMVDMTPEATVVRLVNTFSRAKSIGQQEVWRLVYQELYYRYRISVGSYKLDKGETKIQRLKKLGHIDKVLIVATNILRIDGSAAGSV